jgi:hypothetical protein
MDSATTMDLGGHELKSWRAQWFRVFIVFLSPSRHIPVLYLKLHLEWFIPHSFKFSSDDPIIPNYVYSLNFTPAPKPLATTRWSGPTVGLDIL